MFNYKIDLSTYYPSNENKFNIYVDEMTNKVASNVSLPFVISMDIWKSSYTIYLENLSEGCGEVREIIVDGYTTTTTTINFILTTTKYVAPTTLFTTTTTTTTTSTTITTITTQYVPPTTITLPPPPPPPTVTSPPPPPEVGYKLWYNNPKSITLRRENCPSGCEGTYVTYNVESGKYYITRLDNNDDYQSEVDAIAENDINSNGQNYANQHGNCVNCPSDLYYNTQQTITKIKDNCPNDCTGTSVDFIVYANSYSSNISVEDANLTAITENQGNAQVNANLNGSCTDCPPSISDLSLTVGTSCIFGNGYGYITAYGGVPFENNSYEYNIDGGSWLLMSAGYGQSLLSNGLHTGNVKDSRGVTTSIDFNINCTAETTTTTISPSTTTTIPPCSCKAGYVLSNVTFMYTDCSGMRISGRADVGGLNNICYDTTRTSFGVNLGTESDACTCS